jgi:hypothetical protein
MSEAHKGKTNMLGKTHSEEARQKMSKAHKGKTHSEEHRQKISEAGKGKIISEETRQKMSLFQRNKEGVKGYTFDKSRNKYLAQIKVGEKRIYLGCFNTPEEASQAYQQAKLIYYA